MSVPAIILDGSMVYGSFSITTSAGTTFILNNFTVTRPSTEAMDENTVGSPQRRRETHGLSEFTAECQLASSSTNPPKFGDTFSLTCDANYGSETWVFSPVEFDANNQPGAIRVVPVKGKKVMSGSITTSGTANS